MGVGETVVGEMEGYKGIQLDTSTGESGDKLVVRPRLSTLCNC
jgi:hypothetical protein